MSYFYFTLFFLFLRHMLSELLIPNPNFPIQIRKVNSNDAEIILSFQFSSSSKSITFKQFFGIKFPKVTTNPLPLNSASSCSLTQGSTSYKVIAAPSIDSPSGLHAETNIIYCEMIDDAVFKLATGNYNYYLTIYIAGINSYLTLSSPLNFNSIGLFTTTGNHPDGIIIDATPSFGDLFYGNLSMQAMSMSVQSTYTEIVSGYCLNKCSSIYPGDQFILKFNFVTNSYVYIDNILFIVTYPGTFSLPSSAVIEYWAEPKSVGYGVSQLTLPVDLELTPVGTKSVQISGFSHDLIPGNKFTITFKTSTFDCSVKHGPFCDESMVDIKVYYKNSWFLIMHYTSPPLTNVQSSFTWKMDINHPEGMDVYSNAGWPLRFSITASEDLYKGFILIKVQNSNENFINIYSSTCDFSENIALIFSNDFGKRPHCSTYPNESSTSKTSGFFFPITFLPRGVELKVITWAMIDSCGNSYNPITNLNAYQFSFEVSFYNHLNHYGEDNTYNKPLTRNLEELFSSMFGHPGTFIMSNKCFNSKINNGNNNDQFNGLYDQSFSGVTTSPTDVLMFKEITDFSLGVANESNKDCSGCYLHDINNNFEERYIYSASMPLSNSWVLLNANLYSVQNKSTKDIFPMNVNQSGSYIRGYYSIQFSSKYFEQDPLYSTQCILSVAHSNGAVNLLPAIDIESGENNYIATSLGINQTIDRSSSFITSGPNFSVINSKINTGTSFRLFNSNSIFTTATAKLGLFSNCIHLKLNPDTPKSLYQYFDIQIKFVFVDNNNIPYTIRNIRFIKLLPEHSVFYDKAYSFTASQSSTSISNGYISKVNDFLYRHFTTLANGDTGICLLEINGVMLTNGYLPEYNALMIFFTSGILFDVDYYDLGATYPIPMGVDPYKWYGFNNPPMMSDYNSLAKATLDGNFPIRRYAGMTNNFQTSYHFFIGGNMLMVTGLDKSSFIPTITGAYTVISNLLIPYYCTDYPSSTEEMYSVSHKMNASMVMYATMSSHISIEKVAFLAINNQQVMIFEPTTRPTIGRKFEKILRQAPINDSNRASNIYFYTYNNIEDSSLTAMTMLFSPNYIVEEVDDIYFRGFDRSGPTYAHFKKFPSVFYYGGYSFNQILVFSSYDTELSFKPEIINSTNFYGMSLSSISVNGIKRRSLEEFTLDQHINNVIFCGVHRRKEYFHTNQLSSKSAYLNYNPYTDNWSTTIQGTDEVYQDSNHNSLTFAVNTIIPLVKGSYVSFDINYDYLRSSSICSLCEGSLYAKEFVPSGPKITVVKAISSSAFTISCYNIPLIDSIIISNGKSELIPSNNAYMSGGDVFTNTIVHSTGAFLNVNTNVSTQGIAKEALRNKITLIEYKVPQKNAYTSAVLTIEFGMYPPRNTKILIQGPFSKMLPLPVDGTGMKCFFASVDSTYGDGLIDSCTMRQFGLASEYDIEISLKNISYYCGNLFKHKLFHLSIGPIKAGNFKELLFKAYTYSVKIKSMDEATDITNNNFSTGIAQTIELISPPVLEDLSSLCPVTVNPSIVGMSSAYQFIFNGSFIKANLNQINEVTIFFPLEGELYPVQTYPITVKYDTTEMNISVKMDEFGMLTIPLTGYANISIEVYIRGIITPYIAKKQYFLCSMNSSGRQLITGVSELEAGSTYSPVANLILLQPQIPKTMFMKQITRRLRIGFNMFQYSGVVLPLIISDEPYVYVTLPDLITEYKDEYTMSIVSFNSTSASLVANSTTVMKGMSRVQKENLHFKLGSSITFPSSFAYFELKFSYFSSIDFGLVNDNKISLLLSNNKLTPLYKTSSNANVCYSTTLLPSDPNLGNKPYQMDFTYDPYNYEVQILTEDYTNTNYSIKIYRGRFTKILIRIHKKGSALFHEYFSTQITMTDIRLKTDISSVVLSPLNQLGKAMLIGIPCNSGSQSFQDRIFQTNNSLTVPLVSINIDSSTLGEFLIDAGTNLAKNFFPVYVRLSNPSVDDFVIKFEANLANNPSIMINSNNEIKVQSGTLVTNGIVYNGVSQKSKNSFRYTSSNSCFSSTQTNYDIYFELVPQIYALYPPTSANFEFENSKTVSQLPKSAIMFRYTPAYSPGHLFCVLIHYNSTFPTNDVINVIRAASPFLSNDQYFYYMHVLTEYPHVMWFTSLERGSLYKLKCNVCTIPNTSCVSIEMSYFISKSNNQVVLFTPEETDDTQCLQFLFGAPQDAYIFDLLLNYCQGLFAENQIYEDCIICQSSKMTALPGLQPVEFDRCLMKQLPSIETAYPGLTSFVMCPVIKKTCSYVIPYDAINTQINKELSSNQGLLAKISIPIYSLRQVRYLRIDIGTQIKLSELIIKNVFFNRAGNFEFDLSYNVTDNPLLCYFKIAETKPFNITDIQSCTDISRCGNITNVNQISQKLVIQSDKIIPFKELATNAWIACQDSNCELTTDVILLRKIKFCSNAEDMPLEDNPELCYAVCPSGYYEDKANQRCGKCDISCATCTGSMMYCLTCNIDGNFLPLEDNQSSCKNPCPDSYWKNSTIGQCSLCGASCKTCDVSASSCKECAENYYQMEDNLYKCVLQCPEGYFLNSTICIKCDRSCKACNETRTQCVKCATGYFHLLENESSCFSSPPPGYWKDPHGFYSPCDISCKTCLENNSEMCVTCANSYLVTDYFSDGVKCGKQCRQGYYFNQLERRCKPCDESCSLCDISAHNCINDCAEGYRPLGIYNICVPEENYCGPKEFYSITDKQCYEDCRNNKTIAYEGDGINVCINCKYQGLINLNNVECIKELPSNITVIYNDPTGSYNYYEDCKTRKEFSFNNTCIKNCSSIGSNFHPDSSNNCVDVQFNDVCLLNNVVVPSCPLPFGILEGAKPCTCVSCQKDYRMLNFKGKCVNQCSFSYVNINGICEYVGPKDCFADEGNYLYDGNCVNTCPFNAMVDLSTKTCHVCSSTSRKLYKNQCVDSCPMNQDLFSIANDVCYEKFAPCRGNDCLNGGVCKEWGKNNSTCVCINEYAGQFCQYTSSYYNKFVDDYNLLLSRILSGEEPFNKDKAVQILNMGEFMQINSGKVNPNVLKKIVSIIDMYKNSTNFMEILNLNNWLISQASNDFRLQEVAPILAKSMEALAGMSIASNHSLSDMLKIVMYQNMTLTIFSANETLQSNISIFAGLNSCIKQIEALYPGSFVAQSSYPVNKNNSDTEALCMYYVEKFVYLKNGTKKKFNEFPFCNYSNVIFSVPANTSKSENFTEFVTALDKMNISVHYFSLIDKSKSRVYAKSNGYCYGMNGTNVDIPPRYFNSPLKFDCGEDCEVFSFDTEKLVLYCNCFHKINSTVSIFEGMSDSFSQGFNLANWFVLFCPFEIQMRNFIAIEVGFGLWVVTLVVVILYAIYDIRFISNPTDRSGVDEKEGVLEWLQRKSDINVNPFYPNERISWFYNYYDHSFQLFTAQLVGIEGEIFTRKMFESRIILPRFNVSKSSEIYCGKIWQYAKKTEVINSLLEFSKIEMRFYKISMSFFTFCLAICLNFMFYMDNYTHAPIDTVFQKGEVVYWSNVIWSLWKVFIPFTLELFMSSFIRNFIIRQLIIDACYTDEVILSLLGENEIDYGRIFYAFTNHPKKKIHAVLFSFTVFSMICSCFCIYLTVSFCGVYQYSCLPCMLQILTGYGWMAGLYLCFYLAHLICMRLDRSMYMIFIFILLAFAIGMTFQT